MFSEYLTNCVVEFIIYNFEICVFHDIHYDGSFIEQILNSPPLMNLIESKYSLLCNQSNLYFHASHSVKLEAEISTLIHKITPLANREIESPGKHKNSPQVLTWFYF